MMWNWLVSGLASGATLLLYDGSPFHPDGNVLWDYAAAETVHAVRHLGEIHRRRRRRPGCGRRKTHDLATLRSDAVDRLAAGAGELRLRLRRRQARRAPGLDLRRHRHRAAASCSAIRRSRSGAARSRAAALGLAVEVFDDDGKPMRERQGRARLHASRFPPCRSASGTIPTASKYRAAYFERFPRRLAPWRLRRVDRARRHHHPRPLRRDAQSRRRAHRHGRDLSPGRAAAEVQESIVIGQDWDNDVRVVLFVSAEARASRSTRR